MSSILRLSRIPHGLKTSHALRLPTRPLIRPLLPRTSHHVPLRRPHTTQYLTESAYNAQSTRNKRIMYALMGINISIFIHASYLQGSMKQGNSATPFIHFLQNMTLNLEDIKAGRWWTTYTCTLTHLEFGHLAFNMLTLYFLGSLVATHPLINATRFIGINVGAGITGSLGHLLSKYREASTSGQRDRTRALGFSGSVMGLTTVAACLSPSTVMYIWGIVPVPLWAMVLGYFAYDGYYLNDPRSSVGHAGHLGGMAFGVAYYLTRLRGMRVIMR